jgi:hypothetical protein
MFNDQGKKDDVRTNLSFDPNDPGIFRTTDFETVSSTYATPEECVLQKRKSIEELSEEAKCILKSILKVPNAIADSILSKFPEIEFPESIKTIRIVSKKGKVSQIKIRRYLVGKHHDKEVKPIMKALYFPEGGGGSRGNWPEPDSFVDSVLKEIFDWLEY